MKILLSIAILALTLPTHAAVFPTITMHGVTITNWTDVNNWQRSGTTNSTLAGVAIAGGGVIVGTDTNGGWAPLPSVTDMEGGTVYSAANLNFIQNGFVQLSANYLTNFYGGAASVIVIGYNTPSATDIAKSNGTVTIMGDYAGSGAVLSRCYNVTFLGASSQNATNIDSHDVYTLGDSSLANSIYLTNCAGVVNIGISSGNGSYAENSSSVVNVGTSAGAGAFLYGVTGFVNYGGGGNNARLTNCFSLFNFGSSSGGGVKGTNASNIYNIGENAGGQNVLQNTISVYSFGFHSGDEGNIYSSDGVYNLGSEVGMHNSLDHVTHWMNLGFNSGTETDATNTSNIYALGGLKRAILNNSVDVVTLGQTAGDNISGAYTNVVLVGDGATLGSTGQNLFVLPPGMTIRIGTNTISVSGTNLVFNGRSL